MLYPKGFARDRAIELGALIKHSYTQFEQRSLPVNQQSWQPAGYTMVTECKVKQPNGEVVPFGFIATKDKNVYIIFRGTRTPFEWIDDAAIKQVDYLPSWGKTTKGFNNIYSKLSQQIISALNNLQKQIPSITNIFVTGHSLGAAIADLCAPDILSHTSFKPISYTFAGPRTGDINFAKKYLTSGIVSWRIFNTEDIVTTLPLPTFDIHPSELGLDDSTVELSLKLILSNIASNLLFEHIGTPIAFTFHKETIADNHNLDNYLKNLPIQD